MSAGAVVTRRHFVEVLPLALPSEGARADALTVLVVEDDALAASYVASALHDTGHVVAGAASSAPEAMAIAALAISAGVPVDVAIVDAQLGGATQGIDLALALHARFDMAVIFLTEIGGVETVVSARGGVLSTTLTKPLCPSRLFRALETVRRMRR